MIDVFLPRDKVYISCIDADGVVTQTKITTDGIEYLTRYYVDQSIYESWFYDFEVKKQATINA